MGAASSRDCLNPRPTNSTTQSLLTCDQFPARIPTPDHDSTHSGQFLLIWTKNNHLCIIASKRHYIMNVAIPDDDEDRKRPGGLRGQYLQKSNG